MPIEAYNSIGLVERYHVPLRRTYDIISKELPLFKKEERLQIIVKTINDTTGLNGLIPTLFIFGTYLRISREDRLTISNVERAAIIKKAITEVHRCYDTQKVVDAINIRNSLKVTAILALPLNSDVLIQRENELYQSGPYKLVIIHGYTCKI